MFHEADEGSSWLLRGERAGQSRIRPGWGRLWELRAPRGFWQFRDARAVGTAASAALVLASLSVLDFSIARLDLILGAAANLINGVTAVVACALVVWWALGDSQTPRGIGNAAMVISAVAAVAGSMALTTLL
jgi:hypothetical protein